MDSWAGTIRQEQIVWITGESIPLFDALGDVLSTDQGTF